MLSSTFNCPICRTNEICLIDKASHDLLWSLLWFDDNYGSNEYNGVISCLSVFTYRYDRILDAEMTAGKRVADTDSMVLLRSKDPP